MTPSAQMFTLRDQAARDVANANEYSDFCRAHGVLNIVLAANRKYPVPTDENIQTVKDEIESYLHSTSRRTEIMLRHYSTNAMKHASRTNTFKANNNLYFKR